MKRVSSPKVANENMFVEKQRNLNETPMLLPMTEGEFLRQRANGKLTKELIKDTDKNYSLIDSDSGLDSPQPRLTEPEVSTVPDFLTTGTGHEVPSLKSQKKQFPLGKSMIICAMLVLATDISMGGQWTGTHALIEYWKSSNLPNALEAIFVGSSAEKHSAQAEPVTPPDFNDLAHQLNVIARDVSLMQQNIKELASAQEQIRTAHEQKISETQSQLAALQAQLNAKWKPQSAAPERRKFNRSDSRFIWR